MVKLWLKGLFAALISAFATALGAVIVLPEFFNLTHDGQIHLCKVVLVPSVSAVAAYLKKSPLPGVVNLEASAAFARRTAARWKSLMRPSGAGEGDILRSSPAALVALLLIPTLTFGMMGCSAKQTKQAAAEIIAAIPNVNHYLDLAADAAASLTDPPTAALIVTAHAAIKAGLTSIAALCTSYAQKPDATVWASIKQTVNDLVNKGADAVLDAAKIEDPDSRQKAKLVLGALQTALLIVDGIIQQTQSAAANAQIASLRRVRLREYSEALDHRQIEVATGQSFDRALTLEQALGF